MYVQEHSERLLCEHIHRLFEVFAWTSNARTLSCEEVIDHPASHVVSTLLKLLIHILSTVVTIAW